MNDEALRKMVEELDDWLLRLKRELGDRTGQEKPMTIPWNETFKNDLNF